MIGRTSRAPVTGTNAAIEPVAPNGPFVWTMKMSMGAVFVFLFVSLPSGTVTARESAPEKELSSDRAIIRRILRDIQGPAHGRRPAGRRTRHIVSKTSPRARTMGHGLADADLADDWLKTELTYISTLQHSHDSPRTRQAHRSTSHALHERRNIKHILTGLERLLETNQSRQGQPATKWEIRRTLNQVLKTTSDPSLRNRALLLWLAFHMGPPNDAEARSAPELMALYDKRHPFAAQPPQRPRWHFSMELFGSFSWLDMDFRKVSPGFSLWLPGMRLAWRWKRIAAHLSIQSQSISYVSAQFGVRFYSFRNSRFRISHAIGLGATLGAFFDVDDDDGLFVAPWATASLVEAWVRIYKGLWLHVSPTRVQSFLLGAGFITFDVGLLWEF